MGEAAGSAQEAEELDDYVDQVLTILIINFFFLKKLYLGFEPTRERLDGQTEKR